MKQPVTELTELLKSCNMIQVLEVSSKGGQISALCRQTSGKDKEWLTVVVSILELSDKEKIDLLIARRYLLKDGKLAFGWYLEIRSNKAKELSLLINKIKPAFTVSPRHTRPKNVAGKRIPESTRLEPKDEDDEKVFLGKKVNSNPKPWLEDSPPNSAYAIRVVRKEIGSDGRMVFEQEMPLPHVSRDLNIPNAKGKGATKVG